LEKNAKAKKSGRMGLKKPKTGGFPREIDRFSVLQLNRERLDSAQA
jgi:hypothetical protein